jgi:N utilization substance protein B
MSEQLTLRRRGREVAFQVIYRSEFAGGLAGLEIGKHFEHFDVPPMARDFARTLAEGTVGHLGEIDSLIETTSKNWKLARMPLVDRSLLRLALYEIRFAKEPTPAAIVIDEALELAKRFGSAESAAFINGVLDTLSPKN